MIQASEIREKTVELIYHGGGGHIGGDLSETDVMVVLFDKMKHDPKNPKWEGRDYFILSKGHGTELSDAKLGETAIVLGCGCIGLCTIMSLKARGVTEIYAADVLDKRLEKALEVGATRVFNSTRESIEEFAKTLPGGGADQVYECAGNRITTLQTCRLIKRAGKVTLTGVSPEPVLELDIATLNAMEGTIYSVYRYRNLYPKAIKAVSGGLIPLKKIVSHVFDFKDCIHAIEYSNDHKDEVIKGVIKF